MNKRAIMLTLPLVLSTAPSYAGGIKGDVQKGKAIFQSMQCALCHTDGGNNLNPDRPLKGATFLQRYPANNNETLEQVIRQGVKPKGMPAFGKDKMSDKDLADVVAYIRSLTPEPNTGKKK